MNKSFAVLHLISAYFILLFSPSCVLATTVQSFLLRDVGIFEPDERWVFKLEHIDVHSTSLSFNNANSTILSDSTNLISGFSGSNNLQHYDLIFTDDGSLFINRLDYDFGDFVIFWNPGCVNHGTGCRATYTTGFINPDGVTPPLFVETTDLFFGNSFFTIPDPSPIPVLPAFWLMGTALIGLIGVSRRKMADIN